MEDTSEAVDRLPVPSLSRIKDELGIGLAREVPQFVPQQFGNNGKHTEDTKGSSLVFSGGGNFLTKYRVQQKDEAGTTRQRKRTDDACVSSSNVSPMAAPDRMNVQLNNMLVHARHHDKLLQVVESHFDSFNAVNLITALHRLATMVTTARRASLRRDTRFKQLIHGLSATLRTADAGDLKPQDLSNAAWALTKLGLLSDVLFGHLSDRIVRTISDFEPVNLSMTLWAFARSGFLDEKLFRVAAAEVKRQLPDFEPQQIANTTWAMAKSGFVDEEVFLSAANLALQKLRHFQPMNYSMLLYSFALAKLPHPKLFEEVGQRCTVEALSSALSSPHVVTNLALAFSDVGAVNGEVFDIIAQVASTSLHNFRPQQIATLMQAFAKAGVRHERLVANVSSAVALRLPEFKHQELQDLFQAFNVLDVPAIDISRASAAQHEDVRPRRNAWLYVFAPLYLLFMVLCLRLGSDAALQIVHPSADSIGSSG